MVASPSAPTHLILRKNGELRNSTDDAVRCSLRSSSCSSHCPGSLFRNFAKDSPCVPTSADRQILIGYALLVDKA